MGAPRERRITRGFELRRDGIVDSLGGVSAMPRTTPGVVLQGGGECLVRRTTLGERRGAVDRRADQRMTKLTTSVT